MFLAAARFISCEDVGVADSTPAESQTEAISGAGPSGKGLRSSRSSALYPHLQRSSLDALYGSIRGLARRWSPFCLQGGCGPGGLRSPRATTAGQSPRRWEGAVAVHLRKRVTQAEREARRATTTLLRPCPRMALVSWKPCKAAQASEN